MLLVSQGLLWLIVLVLCAVVVALARQIGVLHERVAPVGALVIGSAPRVGEPAPQIEAQTLAQSTLTIGAPTRSGNAQLLLFVAPTCPVCKTLLPTAWLFAQDEHVDLYAVGDGEEAEHKAMAERFCVPLNRFINSTSIGRAFHVSKLPFAVLLSPAGLVLAQGLVNTREHLESLLVADEMGLRSVQDYLAMRGKLGHAPARSAAEVGAHG